VLIRFHRTSSSPLSRARFVLAPGGTSRRRHLTLALAVTAALLTGAALADAYWRWRVGPLQDRTATLQELQGAERALEQSRLLQRVSAARGQELERTIDAQNGRLRELEEEVAFLRKARASRP
jgi:hypothetical protein